MQLFKRNKEQQPVRQPALMDGQDGYTFRRSRTITGSLSSGVGAAAEGRSQLSSPRLKHHQLHQYRKALTIGLCASVVCIAGISWLLSQFVRLPAELSYNQAALNGTPNSAAYKSTIESYFQRHPTERFYFQLDGEKLNATMLQAHSELDSVSIDQLHPGAYDVTITVRKPVLSWQSNGTLVYVDASGVAFENNYYRAPGVSVEDQSGVTLDPGNAVASNRFIGFLGRIVSTIDSSGVGSVSKVIIPAGTTREVDIVLAGTSYPIKTHIDRDPVAQATDVANAVKYLQARSVTPAYIDARIAGKAYYQ